MEMMNECKGVGLTTGEELSERHVLEMARKTRKEEVTINSRCPQSWSLKKEDICLKDTVTTLCPGRVGFCKAVL